MRFDYVLDAFYLLNSLLGGLTGSARCSVDPSASLTGVSAAASSVGRKVPTTAFIDVHVVPMDTERVLSHQTVLTAGGRIIALGPVSEIRIPPGAVRIDGRGKYLMPGLADLHTHTAGIHIDELRAFLANGATAVRAVGFSNINTSFSSSGKPIADTLGPRVYVSGRSPAFSRASGEPPRLDSMALYVTAFKATGQKILELPPSYMEPMASQEQRKILDSILVAARRVGLAVSTHAHGAAFEQLLALGAGGGALEHMYGLRQGVADLSVAEMRVRATAIRRAGTWLILTLDCHQARRNVVKDPSVLRQYVKVLQDAGVGLLLGADVEGGSPSLVHGELAALVRAGLTPYQALLTGTRNVAQYFGELGSAGTVAMGKRADLVLLSGNPLANIRHTRDPLGVMVDGRWFDRVVLDRYLIANSGIGSTHWFVQEMVKSSRRGDLTSEQHAMLQVHYEVFNTLTDSLAATASVEPSARERAARNVLSRLVAELAAMRAVLTSEQRVIVDPVIGVWLREQARQGHRVTIPGVAVAS